MVAVLQRRKALKTTWAVLCQDGPSFADLAETRRLLRAVDVLGLQTLGPALYLKLNLRAFLKRPVAGHLDGREVDKNILAAGALNKSIALGGVKPFHNTLFSHY